MDAIRIAARLLVIVMAVAAIDSTEKNQAQEIHPSTLFAQTVSNVLPREFTNSNLSFIALDPYTGMVMAARWENMDLPIYPGSLVKPFTALAYGEQHSYQFPTHICRGNASGCWFPRGHGKVNLTSAIAYSCNSYFRILTANMTAAEISPTAERFGLELPPAGSRGIAFVGLNRDWKISPLKLARAYVELAHRRDQPGIPQILEGMAQSAKEGTGTEVDRALRYPDALVKTGTAACTHNRSGEGDGFAVAMTPADQPQIILLVRVHGVPGSQAAKITGEMLRRIQN
ncbi:MAG TPA: penicillin-binding transpeptidase domain-containing protein [Terriglobales bacterium]|nr:penicillin-binding transpeptidase domain-containing protein [Terriglobales bacterium]